VFEKILYNIFYGFRNITQVISHMSLTSNYRQVRRRTKHPVMLIQLIHYMLTLCIFSVEATKNAKSKTSSSSTGVAVGIVVPLLVIIIVLAILALRYKRYENILDSIYIFMFLVIELLLKCLLTVPGLVFNSLFTVQSWPSHHSVQWFTLFLA